MRATWLIDFSKSMPVLTAAAPIAPTAEAAAAVAAPTVLPKEALKIKNRVTSFLYGED